MKSAFLNFPEFMRLAALALGLGIQTSLFAGTELPSAFTFTLPSLPEDVAELKFRDFFLMPIGRRGLEMSPKLPALDGWRVRIVGYMAQQEDPHAGFFMLTPVPVNVAEASDGLAGVYETAGFPKYTIAADGYPVATDTDRKMLIGYGANADRHEDWLTNAQPIRDSQQPFNGVTPLNTYPADPLKRDIAGNFLVTGQVEGTSAVHTGSDIPLSALGPGASMFTGIMDNADVFFKLGQAALGGARRED